MESAIALVEATDERLWEADLHRLRGKALAAASTDRMAMAEACMVRAIEIARDRGAKLIELRAATSLAQLWAEHGERRRAHDLLAPVYGWFTEGFEAPNLRDARSLLSTLA